MSITVGGVTRKRRRSMGSTFKPGGKHYETTKKKKSKTGARSGGRRSGGRRSGGRSSQSNANFSDANKGAIYVPPPITPERQPPRFTGSIPGSSPQDMLNNAMNIAPEIQAPQLPQFNGSIPGSSPQDIATNALNTAPENNKFLDAINTIREFTGANPIGVDASFDAPDTSDILRTLPVGSSGNIIGKVGARGIYKASLAIDDVLKIGKSIAPKTTARLAKINTKTSRLITSVMEKKGFDKAALVALGGWAGMVFWGQWGQAEANDQMSITMRDLLKESERSGDWGLYEEGKELRDNILNQTLWEKLILASPVAPIEGTANKILASHFTAKAQDKVAQTIQERETTGESWSETYQKTNEEKAIIEQETTDYYNEQRILTEKSIQEIRQAAADERDAATRKLLQDTIAEWEAYAKSAAEREAEERRKQAEFWKLYQEELRKLQEDRTPSKLNFGLL